MRPDPAGENRVAVDNEMVRSDCRRQVRTDRGDIVDRFLGGNVLEHDAQLREPAPQRIEHPFDEHRLAIEDIDLGLGRFAMNQ